MSSNQYQHSNGQIISCNPNSNELECDSKRIASIELFRPKEAFSIGSSIGKTKRAPSLWTNLRMYHIVFIFLYVHQTVWVVQTIGKPYRQFLDKAEREGFDVMEGTTKLRAQLSHALSDINDPNRSSSNKLGWFDWMHMDIEEHVALKQKQKKESSWSSSVLDTLPKSRRVPKRYAPSFMSLLCTGILVTLHLFVILLQIWSVKFHLWINYVSVKGNEVKIPEDWMELEEDTNPLLISAAFKAINGAEKKIGAKKSDSKDEKGMLEEELEQQQRQKHSTKFLIKQVEENNNSILSFPMDLPTHACITPTKTGESPVLVPVVYFPTLGATVEYHRRRYYFNQDDMEWVKIRCNTTMPLVFLREWRGITSVYQKQAAGIRFGENKFDVRQPSFKELYKAQLLSPFTVFQLFCVVLWMLDDYWQYSAFTLFMILVFEATVVFSRIKSLSALRGMGNQARIVHVFREDEWCKIMTTELLPGDIMSLTRCVPPKRKDIDHGGVALSETSSLHTDTIEDGDVVPADVLLLRGSTVVNEASLTGESVPQMKEGIRELIKEEHLDMKTRHKTHVLYAGTKMLQCKGVEAVTAEEISSDEEDENLSSVERPPENQADIFCNIPNSPDGGCICLVLRTGFFSAQGKLVRMIEGSQEKVKGHERETALLLLLLFFFAVASSSYVLYHGLQNESRSHYELLLHCILIITSVIPPELPMQMALAVNNSLMTLMKLQIFCTEPYRVPIAGKLDSCLFDKTGTLTTDELVPVGVLEVKSLGDDFTSLIKSSEVKNRGKIDNDSHLLTPMTKLSHDAALVLAGCHSLVLIDGDSTGDPLESAALKAMRWEVAMDSGHVIPSISTEKKQGGKSLYFPNTPSPCSEIEILSRHHFSSKLQRMSCVVKDVDNRRLYSVVKGSPEMVGSLLSYKPEGYDDAAKYLSRRGYRVISLAYKPLSSMTEADAAKDSRSLCEEKLRFAGFVAFTCRVRRDTKAVLRKLKEGGMSVAMVTGDALLTAIHVAKEVDICDSECSDESNSSQPAETNKELNTLLETRRAENSILRKTGSLQKNNKVVKQILILEQDDNGKMFWQSYNDSSRGSQFVAMNVPKLADSYDLAVTGSNLAAAYEYDDATKAVLSHFKVFARMSPDAKETVIEYLHSIGKLCLMCGDGANDVGALKQADVGVALLSGFGDVNVDRGEDGNKKEKVVDVIANTPNITVISKQDMEAARKGPLWLLKLKLTVLGVDLSKYPELTEKEDLLKLYEIKGREKAVTVQEQKKIAENAKKAKEEAKAKHGELMVEKQRQIALRVKELEEQGVQWAQFKAMQEFMSAEMQEGKKKKAAMAKKNSIAGSAATIAAQLENLEMDELPMVKVGDASVAAPFTSKIPSIRSCVDIVRQGRCTLVTSIQMYQILALNCLISAYSLSVLYLDGVKYGDTQMTAMGMLGSISFMSVSRAKPLDKLSSVKPLTSIFHPSLFISLLGQFAVHLSTMMWAVRSAKQYLDEDHKVDLDGQFKPGILNSVVFLVSNVQQVTVFVVNLQGRPFMTGLTENRPLLWSLVSTFILTFMFASETVPGLNKYFELVPFPDDEFRDFIIRILIGDVALSFLFDRAMKALFCPEILRASVEGTTVKDVMSFAKTVAMIGFLMKMFLGNSEQWEEMMERESQLLMEGSLNDTNVVSEVGSLLQDKLEACVGSHCEASFDSLMSVNGEF